MLSAGDHVNLQEFLNRSYAGGVASRNNVNLQDSLS